MNYLFKTIKPQRAYITVALLIKSAGTFVELAIPYILSYILDYVVETNSVKHIVLWGAMMVLCALCALIFNIIANRMAARVARNATEKIRHSLFERILTLSASQVDTFTVPSLESRLTSDTYNVHGFLGMMMRMGVRAPLLLIGGLIVTAILDPVLTLVMIVVTPLISLTVYTISKKGIPLFRKNQASVDAMVRVVREDSKGIRVIKALSKSDYERRRFDTANKALVADETHASTTMALSNPLVTFLLNFGLVSVITVGAFRANGGLTQPGKIIAFIQYFTLISNAMIGITRIFVRSSKGIASMQRISEVILTPDDMALESTEDYPIKKNDGYISFDNVSFAYKGRKSTLDNISFKLERGQSLGIIGATGSGKTTLAMLLMRFYDVDCGSVRIDGRDVRTIARDELHSMFGAVMQNDFIYNGSIGDNIDFGRNIPLDEIKMAAEYAQASEFIDKLADGYDHELTSKGTNVSGGQKQRILISRALAGKPDILILDDASSALDYKTDSALRKSIRENFADTTTVVIAQRVSSVMNCDLILVLDEGRVIGKGSHSELLSACDVYREISESQIGGAFLD